MPKRNPHSSIVEFNEVLKDAINEWIKNALIDYKDKKQMSLADIGLLTGQSRQSVQQLLTPGPRRSVGFQTLYKIGAALGMEPRMIMPSLNQAGIFIDEKDGMMKLKYGRQLLFIDPAKSDSAKSKVAGRKKYEDNRKEALKRRR